MHQSISERCAAKGLRMTRQRSVSAEIDALRHRSAALPRYGLKCHRLALFGVPVMCGRKG